MADILATIMAQKALEVEAAKKAVPASVLEHRIADLGPCQSLRASLEASRSGIIAEFKRKSPSKGWIHPDARVEDVVPAYTAGGAGGLSILTDGPFFGGSADFVRTARPLTPLPILRKEFIRDEYQILEAREMGADAVLLIAAALPPARVHTLAAEARALGLEVLLEIHREEELDAYDDNVTLLGVNNRDLTVFKTDPEQSARLFDALPRGPLPVTESGLLSPSTARRLREVGYRGFLIGEAFMRESDPGAALRQYIAAL